MNLVPEMGIVIVADVVIIAVGSIKARASKSMRVVADKIATDFYFPKHNCENAAVSISSVPITPKIFPIALAAYRTCSASIS